MARVTKPLTNTEVERARPKEKEYNLVDGQGLSLRVKITGTKTWIFNYYHPTTKKRTNFTIGNYPEITIAQARQQREEWRVLLAQGIDPQTHKARLEREQELAEANTFLAVAEKWRAKKQGEIADKTLAKYWSSLRLHIFPFIGSYPIAEIVPTLALIPLQRVEQRNNIDMANRLAGYINEILNFAVNGGLIPFNPCLKMNKTLKQHKKENNPHINSEELPAFMEALANAKIQPQTRFLVQFQMLTMTRPNEASGAQWSEIDLTKKLWTIPAERMKAREVHIIPLSSQAIKILEELEPITGRFKYIFPKRGNNHEPMNSSSANMAIKRLGYAGKQTAHLRGLARTHLADTNVIYEHAEACLAHRTGSNVSQSYNHATYMKQRKKIMQDWGDYVEQCAQGTDLFK
ncbi:tyrosine-type recombinase/integrase [Rodentibacter caecimuris]|uniref:tyrosine-type recombinase/integrase n=1 Tax=Rodentibacter caecimuris TaxID=1796644 RepID=UPI0022497116|nr:integrase arm-type DNA-binding domain-containing protein [Rodentibacter heylii]MCX2961899.1 integrase arm-type DNA-binding domain-containing protein [Rodentibacter heylii]